MEDVGEQRRYSAAAFLLIPKAKGFAPRLVAAFAAVAQRSDASLPADDEPLGERSTRGPDQRLQPGGVLVQRRERQLCLGLKAGAQGIVVLSLYHDSAGNAAKIKVAESPHPALTCAAITAVKQWKWRLFKSEDLDRPILGKLTFKFIIVDSDVSARLCSSKYSVVE